MNNLEMFAVRVDGDLKHALKLEAVKRKITMQELFEEIATNYFEKKLKEEK